MSTLARHTLLLAAGVLACTTLHAVEREDLPTINQAKSYSYSCNAQAAKFLEGQPFTEDLPERARQAAGASEVRILTQGQFITKEYKMGRLNITVDDNRRTVLRVYCG